MRAEKTRRLVTEKDTGVRPEECLFISPHIEHLEDVLMQMAQPEWDDGSGKLRIDKQPRKPGQAEPPSPDAYDAMTFAFSSDARAGLVQR